MATEAKDAGYEDNTDEQVVVKSEEQVATMDSSSEPMITAAEKDTEEQEQEGIEMIIELPRDILTAYILTQLGGRWSILSRASQICILFGLVGAYTMQFAVFFSFIGDLEYSNFKVGDTSGEDWWFNLIALAALFMYLWRDIIMFYSSVWFWVGKVERQKNFRTFSKIKDIKKIGKGIKNIKNIKSPKINMRRVYEGAAFWEFRLALIAVFVLYGGFALYSLIAIGNTNGGLVDKMTVAVQIFFVLEIDDWACSLFILGPGVLDDDEFDVSIVLKETEEDANKRIQKRLLSTTLLLVFSILLVYILSNYKSIFGV